MTLNNRLYDLLKFIALVALPAVSAAYFGLAQIWGLPKAEELVGTATVVDTFLGLLLKASTSQFNKTEGAPDGDLVIGQVDGERYTALQGPTGGLDKMAAKDKVKLNVVVLPPTTSDNPIPR